MLIDILVVNTVKLLENFNNQSTVKPAIEDHPMGHRKWSYETGGLSSYGTNV